MPNKNLTVEQIENLAKTSLNLIYNLEHKLKYFNYRTDLVSRTTFHEIVLLFNAIGRAEYFFDKDIINFSKSEILYLFENILDTNLSRIMAIRYELLTYFEWNESSEFVKKTNMSFIKDLKYDDIDNNERILDGFFKDHDSLTEYLDLVNGVEINTAGIFKKLVVILMFYGFTKEDIMLIKKENVNLETGLITFNDKTIFLETEYDKELCNVCMNAQELLVSNRIIKFKDNDYLIRSRSMNIDTTSQDIPVDTKYISRAIESPLYKDRSSRKISPLKVILSGLFCRLLKYEKENNISLSSLTRIECEKVIYKVSYGRNKYGYLLYGDYKKWKENFEL